MLAILATGFADAQFLRWYVTFYIDNPNFRDALFRGYTKSAIVDRMAKLFGSQIQKLNISARFGITASYFNPADAPKRASAPPPFPVTRQSKFGIPEALRLWIESDGQPECHFRQPQDNHQV